MSCWSRQRISASPPDSSAESSCGERDSSQLPYRAASTAAVAPCASTESPTVTNAVVRMSSSFRRPPSSKTRSAKTIDAAPRGPNQPTKRHGRPARSGAEHREGNREHAHDGQAEHRVERDLPREVVQCGTEEHGSEDDERHGCEDGAGLLRELGDVAAAMSSQAAEDRTADERGDEPGASDRLGQREGEQRSGQRNDLEPRLVDEAPAAGVHDDRGGSRARDGATQHAVSDLLGHELDGVAVSDRSFLRQRDGERDEKERHADPVVEAALDVEALTDSDREDDAT